MIATSILDKLLCIKMTKDGRMLHMNEVITYTIEREFLNKVTTEDLIRNIIRLHQEESPNKAVS